MEESIKCGYYDEDGNFRDYKTKKILPKKIFNEGFYRLDDHYFSFINGKMLHVSVEHGVINSIDNEKYIWPGDKYNEISETEFRNVMINVMLDLGLFEYFNK